MIIASLAGDLTCNLTREERKLVLHRTHTSNATICMAGSTWALIDLIQEDGAEVHNTEMMEAMSSIRSLLRDLRIAGQDELLATGNLR